MLLVNIFAVESTAAAAETFTVGSVTYKPDTIEEGDIIGAISVEDAGQKGTFNQVDVSIDDPQNRFEGRSVMMFNSNYLKEDRMVPKKGKFPSSLRYKLLQRTYKCKAVLRSISLWN